MHEAQDSTPASSVLDLLVSLPAQASPPRLISRERLRRWLLGLLCVALLAWLLVPLLVEVVIERRLSSRLSTDVVVGDVDLDLAAPGVVIRGTAFSLDERTDIELPEVAIAWSWRTMLKERPSIEVTDPRARVRIVPGQRPQRPDRPNSDPLERFASLHVFGGSVQVLVEIDSGRVDLEITDISLDLRNTAPRALEQTTHVELEGKIGQMGHLQASGSLAPVRSRDNWSVEFHVRDVDVVPLNPLWNAVVEMDASKGEVSLQGRVSNSGGRLRGRIEPNFTNLRLLGEGEAARHPMGEALFSEMLSGASNAMTFDRPSNGGRRDLLQALIDTDWQTVIEGVIRRGYQRQLNTLTGYVSTIGGVDVAFKDGLLVLHHVSIFRDTGLVETPFIAVEELEVVFDESVREPGVESFKNVVLREPVLTFVAHDDPKRRQMQFDPLWPQKVSSLPFQTRDLRVENGTIRFIEHRGDQVDEVAIEEVTLLGRDMAKVLSAPGQRAASIEAHGLALGVTPVDLFVQYEPASEQGNSHFELEVGALPLPELNPLARTHAGFDASSGTIGLEAVFDTRGGRVSAEVELDVADVQIIGDDERDLEHPVREFMLGRRIRGLDGKRLEVEFARDYESGVLRQVGMELLRKVVED